MLTKDLDCEGNNSNVAYVLHSTEMKAIMVCTPDKNLSGKKCPEFNLDQSDSLTDRFQLKYNAECTNISITPCNGISSVLESYLFFYYFLKMCGISSIIDS